ncbi:MAG: YicC/YloC family endoribonuclease [Chlorobiota bacterium]
MLSSMTGFGRAEIRDRHVHIAAEITSLNGRFLDISCRLPRILAAREWHIRELVRNHISRGTVTIAITLQWQEPPARLLSPELVQAYQRMLQQLIQLTGIEDTLRLEHFLRFPELFEGTTTSETDEHLWKLTQRVLRQALRQLQRMRAAEGRTLVADIRRRLRAIERIVRAIEHRSTQRVPEAQQRLRERIATLLQELPDPQRLYQEFAILADRLDVTEECTRLRSHLQLMRQLLREREPVGRRLFFLLQEMQREANTIGAKADDAQISQWVIQLKEELERIREQVQNIE